MVPPKPIRIRALARDGMTEVLVLIQHPMETGLRKDADGSFVPAHFVTDVQVTWSDRTVLEARMSLAVSQDPLLSFRFRGGMPGQTISVGWTDNLGQRRLDRSTIA